ncbi:hypothetical protein GEMRC1_010662 [Eukaryota sp. GEM-RC1]
MYFGRLWCIGNFSESLLVVRQLCVTAFFFSFPRGSPESYHSFSMLSSNLSRLTLSTSQKREVNILDTDSSITDLLLSDIHLCAKSAFSFTEDALEANSCFVTLGL